MQKYPSALPTESLATLVEIVKSKAVAKRKAEFALAVWNLQGYVQSKAFGDGAINVMGYQGPISTIVDEDDAAEVAALFEVSTVDGVMQSFDWYLLLPLLKWALKMLITLL